MWLIANHWQSWRRLWVGARRRVLEQYGRWLLRSRPEGKLGVQLLGHRQYVGGRWDELGQLQYTFLITQGLRPEHVLFDIGCGCLRGGVHTIPYLAPGHYFGLDKEAVLIEAGLSQELDPQVRQERRPTLIVSADFECEQFGTTADFAIAQSLFSHLPPSLIERCLEKLRPWTHAETRFFATFCETDMPQSHAAAPHDHDVFAYTIDEMRAFGTRTGWEMQYIGDWGHPRGQKMVAYRPR